MIKIKRILGVLLFALLEFIVGFIEKKYVFLDNGIDRFIIISFCILFVCIHFFVDIKKMYDFIYRKRYYLCAIFLLFVTVMGYSGSSLEYWNYTMQGNYRVKSSTVLGKPRVIRVDEYNVSVPTTLSQRYTNFNYKSNILMGNNDSVVLYPGVPGRHISILGRNFDIVYLFLPLKNAFAFAWYSKVLLILMASFELCMIITDKKKLLSFSGAMLITFSGASCWWSNMTILGIGAAAIVIFDRFLNAKTFKWRVVYSILIGYIGANYLMLMYPAWQVPFGYIYLGFVIWLMIINKDKLDKKMLLYIPVVIGIILLIFVPTYLDSKDVYDLMTHTVYPGARVFKGGEYGLLLFSYYLNVFFPFFDFPNPSEYGNFMGFFPIPIIIGIYVLAKNFIRKDKNIDWLIILLTVISGLLAICNFVPVPELISKLSLLSFSTAKRSQLAVGYGCILIIIRFISKYDTNKNISVLKSFFILLLSLLFNVIVIFILNKHFGGYLTPLRDLVLLSLFTIVYYLLLLNHKKTNNILAIIFVLISFFTGVVVHPVTKGFDVFYEKPISKEIKKIYNNDNSARWIAVSDYYATPNFLVANGVKTINSTNFYPNLKMWHLLDQDLKYEDIYNRYSHVLISIVDEETYFELIQEDVIKIYLNISDLKKLNIKYILSSYKIDNDIFNCLYDDGIYIYSVD